MATSEVIDRLSGRPFLLSEASQLGISPRVVRSRAFSRVLRGVYASADTPDSLELRADAALLLAPAGTVLSHHTAAQLRGLPVPACPDVHVTVPPGIRMRVPGVTAHEGRRWGVGVSVRPATSAIDNFVELGACLSLFQLVILGDATVRKGLATCDGLVTATRVASGGRGVRRARAGAGLVRPRVDSPRETWARLLLVAGGLPEPETGYVVRDGDGGWIAEVDLAYVAAKVAIEYDGDLHRVSRRKWRGDVAKRDLLRELGWTVLVLTSDDLVVRPASTIDRVGRALVRAGVPATPTSRSVLRLSDLG